MSAAGPPGHGWLPARARRGGGELAVDRAYFGARRLTEPFYEDPVAAVRNGGAPLLSTPLADLARWSVRPASSRGD